MSFAAIAPCNAVKTLKSGVTNESQGNHIIDFEWVFDRVVEA
jgi:hypothetical protein